MSLSTAGVAVSIGRRDLIADVDIDVRPGEILGLLGPNGAGKSTLLGVLAGDRKPNRGAALLDGRPLRDWRSADLARRRAVMLQSAAIAFAYTAREIVELGRLPHTQRGAVAEDAAAIDEAMRRCDVTHLAARSYLTLSGGERQRVQLARAFAQIATRPADGSARYLLLDEPTASLDLRHQHDALRQVRTLLAPDLGACVVLHDVNLADAWCDRIALLKNGRMVAVGQTQDVLTPELLTQVYEVPMRELADGARRSFVVDMDAAA